MACEGTLFVGGGKAKYGVKDKLDEFVTSEVLEVGLEPPSLGGNSAKWRRQLTQEEVASPEFLAQLQAFLKLQNPAKYDSAPPPPKKKPAPAPHDGRGGKGTAQHAAGSRKAHAAERSGGASSRGGRAHSNSGASTRDSSPQKDDDWEGAEAAWQAAAAAEQLSEDASALQLLLLSTLQAEGAEAALLPEDNPLNFTPRDPRNVWRMEGMLYASERAFRFPRLLNGRVITLIQGWKELGVGVKGAVQWDAGQLLAEFLTGPEENIARLHPLWGADWTLKDKDIVELGAGLGLPAMVAALRGSRVVATDGEEAVMPLLRQNCEAHRFPEAKHPIRCELLPWGDDALLEAARLPPELDLVIAADVANNPMGLNVDNSATWRALVKTLTQLTTEKTLVLIAHTWRGPEKAFFLMLPKAGFTISQVDRAHLHPMFQRAGCPTRLLALHRHPTPTGGGAGGSSAEAEGGILGAPAAGGGEQDA